MVVKRRFLLTWPLKQVWKGDMLFSSEVRSRSEEHNCRLALILQAGSQSKQLGRNAGGKAEKGSPAEGRRRTYICMLLVVRGVRAALKDR